MQFLFLGFVLTTALREFPWNILNLENKEDSDWSACKVPVEIHSGWVSESRPSLTGVFWVLCHHWTRWWNSAAAALAWSPPWLSEADDRRLQERGAGLFACCESACVAMLWLTLISVMSLARYSCELLLNVLKVILVSRETAKTAFLLSQLCLSPKWPPLWQSYSLSQLVYPISTMKL